MKLYGAWKPSRRTLVPLLALLCAAAPSALAQQAAPPAHGEHVNASNTGPTAYYATDLGRNLRYSDLTPSGTITTTHDGQVIERMDISGGIVIAHNNVVIRAVRIRGGAGRYSISHASNNSYQGTDISYVEIDGLNNPDQMGLNLWNFTMRHSHVYGQSTGINFGSNSTIEYTYVHSQALHPGSHNTAMSIHGGSNIRVRFNNLEGSTSSALSLYPRLAPIKNALIEGNLFNNGSYCTYAGDSHVYYAENERIRYINNLFGRKFWPNCGIHGPYAAWDGSRPGNEWTNNVFQGEPPQPPAASPPKPPTDLVAE